MMENKIIKFFLVGLFNTCVNLLIIYFLTGVLLINIIISSTFSFIISNLLSYFINSKFIFHKPLSVTLYSRFLFASLFSFSMSFILNTFFYFLDFHYLLATLVCMLVVPLITFFTHKYWTWKS